MSHTKILQSIFEKKMSDAKDMIDETLNQKLAVELISLYEKKKLDPVGKEDGDIDNDGDEDETDSNLLNRRKAIGKAMKKEDMQYEEEEKEDVKKLDSRGLGVTRQSGLGKPTKKKNTNESLKLDEVDLSHQSAHDHNETEAREKKVGVGKVVRAKGGSY